MDDKGNACMVCRVRVACFANETLCGQCWTQEELKWRHKWRNQADGVAE